VISPHQLGGRRIANAILRPAVVDFIDLSTPGVGTDIDLEEVVLAPESTAVNLALRDLRNKGIDVSVVAIKRGTEPTRLAPRADDVLAAGDHVVVIGDPESLSRFATLAAGA
jgi:voltage-gated potassium channel